MISREDPMEQAIANEKVKVGRYIQIDVKSLQEQLKRIEFELSSKKGENTVATMQLTDDIVLFAKNFER
jgi:hypothetical protein